MTRWLKTDLSLGKLNPCATLFGHDGAVLVAGYLRPDSQELADRRAAVFRVVRGQARLVYEQSGWLVALAQGADSRFWAVRAQPGATGPRFSLLTSELGEEFQDVANIPALSVTSMSVEDSGRIWVLGAGSLLHSEDGGLNWLAHDLPVDSSRDRLVAESGRTLILGECVRASADGGESWNTYGVGDSEVGAVVGSVLALHNPEGVTLASLDPHGQLRPLATFERHCRPYQLILNGTELEFLAVPLGSELGKGLLHYQSSRGGQEWSSQLLDCRPDPGAAALDPGGKGLALNVEGRVLVTEGF